MTDTQAGLLPEPSVHDLQDADIAQMLNIIAGILDSAIGIQKSVKTGSAEYVREAATRLLRPSAPASAEVVERALDAFLHPGWKDSMPDHEIADYQHRMTRALQASGAAAVPEGWKLVPVEPTRGMRTAFHEANDAHEGGDGSISPDSQWAAMLAAAPER